MEEERRRCVTCGTHEWEWDRYKADLWRCEMCEKLEYKVNDIVEADSKGWRPVLFGVNGGR